MQDVVIVGGGLAGLTNAILLSRAGLNVTIVEKKLYPFHRVCGEYISNEVIPFLENHDLFPYEYEPSRISKFWLTSTNGKKAELLLDLGAFGISRYKFDQFLFQKAKQSGCKFILKESVSNVTYSKDYFDISTLEGTRLRSRLVIGAHGKRSGLDRNLNRSFMTRKSPYMAMKYHLQTDLPKDVIALHNFKNGYCGISAIEENKFNLCYLTHRGNLKQYKDIATMERNVLFQNPFIRHIFTSSRMLFDQPIVINEINFEEKAAVENHILMSGDAAGMVTPLCGNGMAMAIRSARGLSEIITKHYSPAESNLLKIETAYTQFWKKEFSRRLSTGRSLQKLFGSKTMSNIGVLTARYLTGIANFLVKQTHGEPFS